MGLIPLLESGRSEDNIMISQQVFIIIRLLGYFSKGSCPNIKILSDLFLKVQ